MNTNTTFRITWKIDGHVITSYVAQGAIPQCPVSVDKADTAHARYTFAGWQPALAPAVADTVYTALYREQPLTPTPPPKGSDMFSARDRVVGFDAATGMVIVSRYKRSFLSRLTQGTDLCKLNYNKIKNYLLSNSSVTYTISWDYERFSLGNTQLAKIRITGNTLYLYLAFPPEEKLHAGYRGQDVSGIKRYQQVPFLFRVTNNRQAGTALELLADLFEKFGIIRDRPSEVDWTEPHPFATDTELLAVGLIREVFERRRKIKEDEVVLDQLRSEHKLLTAVPEETAVSVEDEDDEPSCELQDPTECLWQAPTNAARLQAEAEATLSPVPPAPAALPKGTAEAGPLPPADNNDTGPAPSTRESLSSGDPLPGREPPAEKSLATYSFTALTPTEGTSSFLSPVPDQPASDFFLITWMVDAHRYTTLCKFGTLPVPKDRFVAESDRPSSFRFLGWAPSLAPAYHHTTYRAVFAPSASAPSGKSYLSMSRLPRRARVLDACGDQIGYIRNKRLYHYDDSEWAVLRSKQGAVQLVKDQQEIAYVDCNYNILNYKNEYVGTISRLYRYLTRGALAFLLLVAVTISVLLVLKILGGQNTQPEPPSFSIAQLRPGTYWSDVRQLDIFSQGSEDRVISPGTRGTYEFYVRNDGLDKVYFDLLFSDENPHDIPMTYRLKINNVYVVGGPGNWVPIQDLQISDSELLPYPYGNHKVTLEWQWDSGSDGDDTHIGNQEDVNYTLTLEILARIARD
ncbi:MAG: hypothetical protein WDA00_03685 [Eubacteriales bacterium]